LPEPQNYKPASPVSGGPLRCTPPRYLVSQTQEGRKSEPLVQEAPRRIGAPPVIAEMMIGPAPAFRGSLRQLLAKPAEARKTGAGAR